MRKQAKIHKFAKKRLFYDFRSPAVEERRVKQIACTLLIKHTLLFIFNILYSFLHLLIRQYYFKKEEVIIVVSPGVACSPDRNRREEVVAYLYKSEDKTLFVEEELAEDLQDSFVR